MGRPRKPMTKEQERQIKTLRKKGHTWRAIGQIMGINHMRVCRYAKEVLGMETGAYAPEVVLPRFSRPFFDRR